MIGDLISKSELIKILRDRGNPWNNYIENTIKEMPTAYDVDKVSGQLQNLRDRFDSEDFHIRGILEKAIEIVKSGGVADD